MESVRGGPLLDPGSPYVVDDDHEIAFFSGDHQIDIRLGRNEIQKRLDELEMDSRVTLRPQGADWIEISFSCYDDVDFVVSLVKVAVSSHLRTIARTKETSEKKGQALSA